MAAACTLLLFGSPGVEAAPTGLVAAYSFDAGNGSAVVDNSGSGNTGTISGATWSSSGRYGRALSFDGVNDMVTVAGSSSLDLTSRLTLEAWVRPSQLGPDWRTVAVKERPGFLNYALYAHEGGPGPAGHVYVGSRDRYSPGSSIAANTWTHLATTYDGSALRVYVNGTLSTTLAVSGAVGSSSNPLRIGGNSVWGEWFGGLIDEVRVYNRALSAAEIQSDMTTPVTAPTGDTQAPSVPTSLRVSSASASSITVAWNGSTDNVGVSGYGHHRSGSFVDDGPGTSYTFTGLTCGTTYPLAVDAYDAAGNRSAKVQVNAATSTCPPADTQAPTTPGNVRTTGSTANTISVAWNASTDNAGVAGYGYYSNGNLVSNGTGTSYTFPSLACGTSYTLAVDAYDAAGNRSAKAQVSESTTACQASPPPSGSGTAHLWVDTNGGSCARLASAGAYNDGQACGSFAAAYGAASSGDTVRVRPGTYPAQFFAGGVGASQGEGTKALTFVGESGNVVRQIHIGSNNLTFDGFNIDAGGVKTSGAAFENSGSSFVFKNGQIGNVVDEKGAVIDGAGAVFDNVLFHDVVLQGAGVHLECIQAYAVPNFTIRNSTFTNCGIMGLSLGYPGWWSPLPPPYSGVILEGNTFNAPVPSNNYALAIWSNKDSCSDTCGWGVMTNYRIRNNYIWSLMNRMTTDSSTVICGNRGPGSPASWTTGC